MNEILTNVSRTFVEYLLLPGLTTRECIPANVSLKTPLIRYKHDKKSPIELNIPFTSAIMQAVSGPELAIELARNGGLSFIFGSQPIEFQAEMVRRVKRFKAGFVVSDSNLTPKQTLQDVIALKEKTGHSTVAITSDGTATGKLLGIVTSRDYRPEKDALDKKIAAFMTPFEKLIVGQESISLEAANELRFQEKLNVLPIVDDNQHLVSLVFRKDYEQHQTNPLELSDENKALLVGAGINTRDYQERVPALIKAGVDVLCIDSSDGYSEWQEDCLEWVKGNFDIPIGAGNVVNGEAFRYLVDAGADFIKVGIGGGSICITREQKGIGCGQATAVMQVAKARNTYFKETGIYVPLCSDGGIAQDYHMVLALAMGADFLMMGRYFARFDESPGALVKVNNQSVKEYWGEGSNRARNWQRYNDGGDENLKFEEGVDSYVPYAGPLRTGLSESTAKMKATMCSCGTTTIKELQKNAVLTLVSQTSITEGGAHDVQIKS
jgi:IMP dehydrogenase